VTAGADPVADGLVGEGDWLELSVACDAEAVEAVAEILCRVAPGGVGIEPALTLVDDGLGATVDQAAPATVRAYLPARDAASVRAAIATVDQALGHLAAFGLRPIGELETRVLHESDWAGAWKRHLGILRIGHGLVIRPSWRRHRRQPGETVVTMDPGMAFGTGLHPTTRLCLEAIERWAGEGRLARGGARDGRARLLDVGCGSGILAITACLLGAGEALGLDTDPLAVEATRANARRNRVARRLRARPGSLPTAAGLFDLVAANLVASLLVDLAGALAAELAQGGRLIASGIFVDREAAVREALEAAGLPVVRRDTEGDWVALEAQRLPYPPR
jgi:ribosomal protein L11 methyltransferase